MSGNCESADSGNANEPWPEEEVKEIINHDCCSGRIQNHKHRCRSRATAFRKTLRRQVGPDNWSYEMMKIAKATAKRGNGAESVLVYSGHEEKVRTYRESRHAAVAVIERLGDAAVAETELSEKEIVRAVADLYRHSANTHPGHQGIRDAELHAEIRDVFNRCNVITS